MADTLSPTVALGQDVPAAPAPQHLADPQPRPPSSGGAAGDSPRAGAGRVSPGAKMAAKASHSHVKLEAEIERCRAEGHWGRLRHLAQQLLPPRPPRKAKAARGAQDAGKRRRGAGGAAAGTDPPGLGRQRGRLLAPCRRRCRQPRAGGLAWAGAAAAPACGASFAVPCRRPGSAALGKEGCLGEAAGAQEAALGRITPRFLSVSALPSPRGSEGRLPSARDQRRAQVAAAGSEPAPAAAGPFGLRPGRPRLERFKSASR